MLTDIFFVFREINKYTCEHMVLKTAMENKASRVTVPLVCSSVWGDGRGSENRVHEMANHVNIL